MYTIALKLPGPETAVFDACIYLTLKVSYCLFQGIRKWSTLCELFLCQDLWWIIWKQILKSHRKFVTKWMFCISEGVKYESSVPQLFSVFGVTFSNYVQPLNQYLKQMMKTDKKQQKTLPKVTTILTFLTSYESRVKMCVNSLQKHKKDFHLKQYGSKQTT